MALTKNRFYGTFDKITSFETGMKELKDFVDGNKSIEIYTSEELTNDMYRNDPDIKITVKTTALEDTDVLASAMGILRCILTSWYTGTSEDDDVACNNMPYICYLLPSSEDSRVKRAMSDTTKVLYKDGVWYD